MGADAADPRAHRSDGYVERDGDLGVAQALPDVQEQGVDVTEGKAFESCCDRREFVSGVDGVDGANSRVNNAWGEVSHAVERRSFAPLGAPGVSHRVVGDAHQPGAGVEPGGVVGPPPLERYPEGLAGEIVGAFNPPAAGAVSAHETEVPAEQLREDLRVTPTGLDNAEIARAHRPTLSAPPRLFAGELG